MTNFYKNVKHYRQSKNLKQKDFAKLLNVSDTAISGWENNKHEPSIDKLIEIAELLDVNYEDLLL